MLSLIDNATGLLVNQTSKTLQDMIDSLLSDNQDHSEFTKWCHLLETPLQINLKIKL